MKRPLGTLKNNKETVFKIIQKSALTRCVRLDYNK